MILPMHRPSLILLFFVALFYLNSSAAAETAFERDCATLQAGTGKDGERLNALLKLTWDYTMRENPEFATHVGYPGQNDRWSDISLDALERRKRELHAPLKVIQSIHREKLTAAEQLNYDLFKRNQESAIEGIAFPSEYLQLSQLDGVQQDVTRILEIAPLDVAQEVLNVAREPIVDPGLGLLRMAFEGFRQLNDRYGFHALAPVQIPAISLSNSASIS